MKWVIFAVILTTLAIFHLFLIDGSPAAEKKDAEAVGESQADKKEVKTKEESEKPKFIGFVDENKDGINDKFHDADGDGVNDVTKEEYKHRFKFVDKNNDKVNDVFVDKDGDGVNDLETKFVDEDKDEINDNVLDYDKDGINDITGLKYENEDLMGYRYGIVEEESKKTYRKFIDENGDGMHDPVARRRGFTDESMHDWFVDEDGDGICDGRGFGRHRQHHGGGGMQRGRHGYRGGKR